MNFLFLFCVIFLLRLVFFFTVEHFLGDKPVERKWLLWGDMITMLMYVFLVYPIAQFVSSKVGVGLFVPQTLLSLPLLVRVVLYLIVADFFHYWLHRCMHTKYLWRIHRWHHTPKHMSFASGFRASILDATFVNLAYIFAWPLLGSPSLMLQFGLLCFSLLRNDWMHLNVNTRWGRLEKLFVTPRYHHVHHNSKPDHYNRNLSPLFSVWDRLFGTYRDPDQVEKGGGFGVEGKVSAWRLFLGV